MSDTPQLGRSIGLTPLIFYGLGTMVGGGFYALLPDPVGEGPRLPRWLPPLAASSCLAMLFFQGWIFWS